MVLKNERLKKNLNYEKECNSQRDKNGWESKCFLKRRNLARTRKIVLSQLAFWSSEQWVGEFFSIGPARGKDVRKKVDFFLYSIEKF